MSDEELDKGEFNDTQALNFMDNEMASLLDDQEVTDSDILASFQDSTENVSDALAIGMDDDLTDDRDDKLLEKRRRLVGNQLLVIISRKRELFLSHWTLSLEVIYVASCSSLRVSMIKRIVSSQRHSMSMCSHLSMPFGTLMHLWSINLQFMSLILVVSSS